MKIICFVLSQDKFAFLKNSILCSQFQSRIIRKNVTFVRTTEMN